MSQEVDDLAELVGGLVDAGGPRCPDRATQVDHHRPSEDDIAVGHGAPHDERPRHAGPSRIGAAGFEPATSRV
jgi:hypothetical protein